MNIKVRVDAEKCRELGLKLKPIRVLPDPYIRSARTVVEKRREAEFWFYVIAMCQATRTLQGYIDGKWLRGGDYLLAACRRRFDTDQDFFTANRMRSIEEDELRALLSDDGNPDHSTIDRVAERVGLLRNCARILFKRFNGDIMMIYNVSEGYLIRKDGKGLLNLLKNFRAYSDPVEKKSFLLLLYLNESEIWKMKDLESLKIAVDYHVMRIALRAGLVKVVDDALAYRLKQRKRIKQSEDCEVRKAVREACSILSKCSSHTAFELDTMLWNIGRSCCFYEHDPICDARICHKRDKCSFIRATNYFCPGKCVFDGTCLGSRNDSYRKLWETNVYTEYY